MNGMLFIRPTPAVYEKWKTKHGLDGWGYDDVLPYFKMMENNSDLTLDDKYHGRHGPMRINYYFNDFGADFLLKSMNESRIPIYKDTNAPRERLCGASKVQGTIDDGRRYSPAKAYINPHQSRRNLFIMKCTIVIKVLFNNDNNKTVANGVEVYYNGKNYTIKARLGVVLSAGAFGTPVTLQLSGIGKETDLLKLGVTPLPGVSELNAGHNLLEHITVPVFFKFSGPIQTIPEIADAIEDYHKNPRDGFFTGIGSAPVVVFLEIPTKYGVAAIELQLFMFKKESVFLPSLYDHIPLNQDIEDYLDKLNKDYVILVVIPILLFSKSIGHVKATKKDHTAYDKPEIFYNLFGDPYDREALIRTQEYLQKLPNRSETWRNASAEYVRLPFKACQNILDENTDEFRSCNIDEAAGPYYHPVGTAAMGTGPPAVCNSKGQVFNTSGLWIADASM